MSQNRIDSLLILENWKLLGKINFDQDIHHFNHVKSQIKIECRYFKYTNFSEQNNYTKKKNKRKGL